MDSRLHLLEVVLFVDVKYLIRSSPQEVVFCSQHGASLKSILWSMVITCSAAAELLGWRSVTCVQSVVCAVCILSPLHTHSLDMRHTALFSSHEIRGFTLTTRECIGIASIEVQEVVASLCLLGDDVHTLSEITCTLLASYII